MYLNIRRLLLGATIIFLTSLQPIQAQSQIAGAIKTENGQPLSFANVLLLSASDSSLIKGQVSGEDGG